MAKPATVLFQRGGRGAIVFAGPSVPALAMRAEELRRLHDLARTAMQHAIAGTVESGAFRDALQDLHHELATMMMDLQDAGNRFDVPVPTGMRVASRDFLAFGF